MKIISLAAFVFSSLLLFSYSGNVSQSVPANQYQNPSAEIAENESEGKITQEIHRIIRLDKNMSENAKNIKITTANGVVTLQGPVDSLSEKNSIEIRAKLVTGVTQVNNQLEVVKK